MLRSLLQLMTMQCCAMSESLQAILFCVEYLLKDVLLGLGEGLLSLYIRKSTFLLDILLYVNIDVWSIVPKLNIIELYTVLFTGSLAICSAIRLKESHDL